MPIYARVEKEGLHGVETNKKINRQKSGNLSQKYGDKSSQKSSQKTSQKNGFREKPDWDIRPMPSVELLVQHKMVCTSSIVMCLYFVLVMFSCTDSVLLICHGNEFNCVLIL